MTDTLDVISLGAAKGAINMEVGNTSHDVELGRQITTVSRILDNTVGPIVQRTITAELHDGHGTWIKLRRRPIISVTTVREVQGPGVIATLSAVAWGATTDGYSATDAALSSGKVYRMVSGLPTDWHPGTANVEVTYVAGRYATTAAVDARFAEAAGEILRRLWKRESGIWSQAASVFEGPIDTEPTSGFFRAVKPIITELLFDEIQTEIGVA